MARRGDLPQLSEVVERAFAATTEGSGEVTFMSSGKRTLFETLETRFRIGLDMERRNTPWDWCRHAQVVAEDISTGKILGFAEVWGEDEESLYNMSSQTPQPALFNLCVSASARRRGVASSLVKKCEEVCQQWGDESLHLKVRDDNLAACALYEAEGYDLVETRPIAELPAWQDRWKGGAIPLRVMRKTFPPPGNGDGAAAAAVAKIPPKSFDEFEVTLDSVLSYRDRDALVWFALLLVRNVSFLTPQYRLLPTLAVFVPFVSYLVLVRVLSTNPELWEAVRAAL